MRDLLIILGYRWQAWHNATRGSIWQTLTQLSVVSFILFALMNLAVSTILLSAMLGSIASRLREAVFYLCAQGLAFGALTLALATAANTTLGDLYEAPYLALFLSWPIRPGVLYVSGFCQVLLSSLAAVISLIAPVWAALGIAGRAGAGFIILGLLGLAAVTLFCTGLVAGAFNLVLRYVNALHMRRFLVGALVAGLVAIILLMQGLSMAIVRHGWQKEIWRVSSSLHHLNLLPTGLAVNSAMAARAGVLSRSLGWQGVLWVFASAIALPALWFGARTYLLCWSRAQEMTARRSKRRLAQRSAGQPWPVMSFLRKDWSILMHEPLFWANLLIFLLGVCFYVWTAKQQPGLGHNASIDLQISHFYFIGFLASGWLALAGAMSVSREGAAWWQVQTAPVPVGQLLLAKLCFGISGIGGMFLAAWALLAVSGMDNAPPHVSLAVILGLVFSFSGAGLLADLLLPDFTLRLGVKMSGAHSGGKTKIVLSMLASFGVLVLTLATFYLVLILATPFMASLAVLAEGVILLGLALLLGTPLLRRVILMQ